jgi:hypothetical protein
VKPAVLNASPLIVLAKAGYLDLVPRLLSPVVIPRAVATEISAGSADDPGARFLDRSSWLGVVDFMPALSPLATWRLGQGERRCWSTHGEIPVQLPYWTIRRRDGRRTHLISRSRELWGSLLPVYR